MFVVTPSGVIFKETPEGVTTNIWMIYFVQSPYVKYCLIPVDTKSNLLS